MVSLEQKRAQLARELAALDKKIVTQRKDAYRALGEMLAQAALTDAEVAKTIITVFEYSADLTAGQYDLLQSVMSEVSEKAEIPLSRKRPEGGRGRPRSDENKSITQPDAATS